jgi:hypothetical protein
VVAIEAVVTDESDGVAIIGAPTYRTPTVNTMPLSTRPLATVVSAGTSIARERWATWQGPMMSQTPDPVASTRTSLAGRQITIRAPIGRPGLESAQQARLPNIFIARTLRTAGEQGLGPSGPERQDCGTVSAALTAFCVPHAHVA